MTQPDHRHLSVEGREGIVTVWDHHDRYLGCMGNERWQQLLNDERKAHMYAGITDITNEPGTSWEIVDGVLKIRREDDTDFDEMRWVEHLAEVWAPYEDEDNPAVRISTRDAGILARAYLTAQASLVERMERLGEISGARAEHPGPANVPENRNDWPVA